MKLVEWKSWSFLLAIYTVGVGFTLTLAENDSYVASLPGGGKISLSKGEFLSGDIPLTISPDIQLNSSVELHVSQRNQQKHKQKSVGKKVAKNAESDLITKIRLIPNDRLNRYKVVAARRLQINLVRCFLAISKNTEKVPAGVRAAAKKGATQAGRLTQAIVNNLGVILQKGSQQQGRPAVQLKMILETILPQISPPTQDTLQNVLGFVSANLVAVNTLLGNLLGGVPDLLAGVINSLTSSLGAVTSALTGTLASIGILLGGALG